MLYSQSYYSAATFFDISLTGGSDSTPAAGDIIIVSVSSADTVTFTTGMQGNQQGAFNVVTHQYVNDTYDTNLDVLWGVCGATPDTQLKLSYSTSGGKGGASTIHVFRGVDPTTPFALTTTDTRSNTVLADPISLDASAYTGAWVYASGAGAYSGSAATYSSSDLTGFISTSYLSAEDSVVGAGYVEGPGLGVVNPAEFTFSASNSSQYSCAAFTGVLKPA